MVSKLPQPARSLLFFQKFEPHTRKKAQNKKEERIEVKETGGESHEGKIAN